MSELLDWFERYLHLIPLSRKNLQEALESGGKENAKLQERIQEHLGVEENLARYFEEIEGFKV